MTLYFYLKIRWSEFSNSCHRLVQAKCGKLFHCLIFSKSRRRYHVHTVFLFHTKDCCGLEVVGCYVFNEGWHQPETKYEINHLTSQTAFMGHNLDIQGHGPVYWFVTNLNIQQNWGWPSSLTSYKYDNNCRQLLMIAVWCSNVESNNG